VRRLNAAAVDELPTEQRVGPVVNPLELSRLTGLVGSGPDLVGIDDGFRTLGVCVAATRAQLLGKLAAALLSRPLTRMMRRGRLRVVGHLWEGRRATNVQKEAPPERWAWLSSPVEWQAMGPWPDQGMARVRPRGRDSRTHFRPECGHRVVQATGVYVAGKLATAEVRHGGMARPLVSHAEGRKPGSRANAGTYVTANRRRHSVEATGNLA
jgi:hypothetical protein